MVGVGVVVGVGVGVVVGVAVGVVVGVAVGVVVGVVVAVVVAVGVAVVVVVGVAVVVAVGVGVAISMTAKKTQSSFVRAGHTTKHRLIMATKAMQKSGKSWFGLTMPAPLAVIAVEPGLDGVVERFQDHKEIFVADYSDEVARVQRIFATGNKVMEKDSVKVGDAVDRAHVANMNIARELLDRIKADYLEAIEDSSVRSVFMDTGTELWRLIRLANLGKLEQVKGRYYGNANQEMLSFVRTAYSSDANVLFSHRLKKEYANDKPTGNLELAGFGEMEFEVQLVLQQWKEPDESIPDRFHSMITDCRLDPAKESEEFSGETNTFAFIAASVFGNDPGEWE